MKRHKIELPIYYGFIEIISCKNYNKINKELGINVDNNIQAFAYKKEPHNYVVCFSDNKDLSIIVHEVVHLVNFIYEDHSMKLSKTNDEFQAYLTQYLFSEIVSKINKAAEDLIWKR
jgi:hypothetical protein